MRDKSYICLHDNQYLSLPWSGKVSALVGAYIPHILKILTKLTKRSEYSQSQVYL